MSTIKTKASKSRLQPTEDRLVVKQDSAESVSSGGIIIPDSVTNKSKPNCGVIIAAGPGRTLDSGQRAPAPFKSGQRVLYGQFAGTEIEADGEKLVIINTADVLCTIKD